MKRSFPLWELLGFAVVSLAGTLLHFLYDLTGGSIITAPFSAVNESTWEHMKLFFIPAFAFALIQSRFFKEYSQFWCIKLRGILLGTLLIPTLFYTYNGVFGKSPDLVNILIFFVSAAAAFLYESRAFEKKNSCRLSAVSLVSLFVMAALFVIFTFAPPGLPIFVDPTNGSIGIQ